MLKKNQCYTMSVIDINNEGNGVGKIDGFVVFVPMTATGDVIKVKIVKVLKHYAFGIVQELISPSDDRQEVDCRHFNQCGGCSLRHISYEAECRLKQKFVSDCFKRIGGIELDVDPIVANKNIYHYRNKAQYPLAIKDGRAIAGFYAKRSHRVVECTECYLQPKLFQEILDYVLDFINEFSISVYDEKSHSGLLRNVFIRYGEQTGEIMVCLVSTSIDIPHINLLIDRLTKHFSDIASIVINLNDKDTNVILGQYCKTVFGKDTITDILCGLKFEISPLSFYQINRTQTEKLYGIASDLANLSGGELVVDLYCGTGTIGLSMSDRAGQIIGVEIVPQAVKDAEKNALSNGISNTEFICADAKKAVETLQKRGVNPDVVLLDPPRKGCDQNVLESVCKMQPKRIVMISCNPSTAARDCRFLEQNNYSVERIIPVDLFSRTVHVECVVLLTRSEGK